MRIPIGGLGHRQGFLSTQVSGKTLRSQFHQSLFGPGGWSGGEVNTGQLRRGSNCPLAVAVWLVHGHVSEPGQQFRAAVFGAPGLNEFRTLVDKRGGDIPGDKGLIRQHGLKERNIGVHASNPKLGKPSLSPTDGLFKVSPATGHLGEHRIEIGRYLCSLVHRAAIEADARPTRRPVGRDFSGIRTELCARVFCRDPALERSSPDLDTVLVETEFGKCLPRGNSHLRLDEIHIGHFFGHRVLDLDARVHFNKHVLPGTRTCGVQQELHCSGVDVANLAGEGHRVLQHLLSNRLVQVLRGSNFDDLLMTSLQ